MHVMTQSGMKLTVFKKEFENTQELESQTPVRRLAHSEYRNNVTTIGSANTYCVVLRFHD